MPLKWLAKESVESPYDRAPIEDRETKSRILEIVLWAVVSAIVAIGPARADDALDRTAPFHILPSPLASALIEFSSQSGIQVAAADADVSRPKTSGVIGTMPIRAALKALLQGTGLDYSRVGENTIAIRAAPTQPALGALPRRAGTAPAPPAPDSAPADPDVNVKPPEISEVTVTSPRPPTEQELAGESLHQFIVHHATVQYDYVNGLHSDLARWRGGRQSVCPRTLGLDPAANAFVTARIRAIAAYVGAPVQSDLQCGDNARILFTARPEAIMNDVAGWASTYFRGSRWYQAHTRLLDYEGDRPIQGWYLTTPRGAKVSNTDIGLLRIYVEPLWPKIMPHWLTDDGHMSGIGTVILVVDTTKVAGYALGTIADYAAMVTLSVAQSPDHCDPLPSILDVMAPSCAHREKPAAITAGDLAFLKALYYRNFVYNPSPSRADIEHNMMEQFKGHLR
jgi:hypothetical protein